MIKQFVAKVKQDTSTVLRHAGLAALLIFMARFGGGKTVSVGLTARRFTDWMEEVAAKDDEVNAPRSTGPLHRAGTVSANTPIMKRGMGILL